MNTDTEEDTSPLRTNSMIITGRPFFDFMLSSTLSSTYLESFLYGRLKYSLTYSSEWVMALTWTIPGGGLESTSVGWWNISMNLLISAGSIPRSIRRRYGSLGDRRGRWFVLMISYEVMQTTSMNPRRRR